MQCFALQGRNGIPSPAGAPTRPFAKSVSHVDTMITANGDEPNLYETQAFYGCDRLISCQVLTLWRLAGRYFRRTGPEKRRVVNIGSEEMVSINQLTQ